MPLPWKKSRVSRISRIVADLQPPKPGNSSLVVETGFPTSLVDLFVKNRERLKNPIKKRKKHQQQQQQRFVDELVISDPIPLSSSRDLLVQHDVYMENKPHSPENLEVLKMFVVVVLAFSTKRLALGITLSASLLIFLEYIGKHLFCFLKPSCLSARMAFQSLIQRVLLFFQRRWSSLKGEGKKGPNYDDDSCGGLIQDTGSISFIEEIQVEEARLDIVSRLEDNKGVQHETMRDLLRWDKRWGNFDEDEEEDDGGPMICEKQHSQSCKIRRKIIKKLVPKKLRNMKKGRKGKEKGLKEADSVSEASSCCGEDQLCRNEDTEEQDNFETRGKVKLQQLMEEEGGNFTSDGKEAERGKYGNEEFEQRVPTSNTGLHSKSEKIVVEGNVDIVKGGSSGYLILFLIVLAGLVGGRALALLITVTSCSMLKLVRRRSKLCK
ncbi:hypothetical protein RCOM_1336320 [Ricinus communis]|uniref:Ethylene-responsive nuclear protein n=1 Tax=Ricinus communis TaxID=3988 RepID=B9SB13_RICCO|nr:hypothetical protein RCOM_1336320 [Ricinus communis]